MTSRRERIIFFLSLLAVVCILGSFIWYLQRPRFAVSPGESVIVFSRDDDLGKQLYATTADGSRYARITENILRVSPWLPIPNPFGSSTINSNPIQLVHTNDVLFFSSLNRPSVGYSLYRIGIDGRNQQRVTDSSGQTVAGSPSPNLQWAAQIQYDRALHVQSAEETHTTRSLCLSCSLLPDRVSSFAWSRDSQRLAFATPQGLYLVDVNGANLRKLTPPGLNANEPAWSSDGTRVAFTSEVNDRHRVFIINSDSTELQQITFEPARSSRIVIVDRQPTWSPDNTQIAFMSTRDGEADIYAVDVASGKVERVTRLGDAYEPMWMQVQ